MKNKLPNAAAIIFALIFSTHAIAGASDDILNDKIKEVRDEMAQKSAESIANKLIEFSISSANLSSDLKLQAVGNLNKAVEFANLDGEKFRLSAEQLTDLSEKAGIAAKEIKNAADKAKAIAKYIPFVATVIQTSYDSYQLFNNSNELKEKYPGFPVESNKSEYVQVTVENFLGLVPYLGQAITLTKADRTTFDPYDSMPTEGGSHTRDWVEDMASHVQSYINNGGIPESWKNGTGAPPAGILQYLKGAESFLSSEYKLDVSNWIKNWELVDLTPNASYRSYQAKWTPVIGGDPCSHQNFVCNQTLGNIISGINQGQNSHFGAANIFTGWGQPSNIVAQIPAVLDPSNTSNTQLVTGLQQSALSQNSTAYESTEWVVKSGNPAIHFSAGNSFGSITAPNNGPIAALNNANVVSTTMERTFYIPAGVKQVTVGMLANFVTNEYPTYVGSQYNDKSTIEIKTGSGNVYQATLFNKTLNSANFQTVTGLPSPLYSTGGQTGFETISKSISVANGGSLTITVKTINVGDTAVPSATLINSTKVK